MSALTHVQVERKRTLPAFPRNLFSPWLASKHANSSLLFTIQANFPPDWDDGRNLGLDVPDEDRSSLESLI